MVLRLSIQLVVIPFLISSANAINSSAVIFFVDFIIVSKLSRYIKFTLRMENGGKLDKMTGSVSIISEQNVSMIGSIISELGKLVFGIDLLKRG